MADETDDTKGHAALQPATKAELAEAAMRMRLMSLGLLRAVNGLLIGDDSVVKDAMASLGRYDKELEEFCIRLLTPQEKADGR